jgi:hypothetical protein
MRSLLLVLVAVAVGVVVGRTGAGVAPALAQVECPPVRDADVLPAVLAVAQRPIESEPVFVGAADDEVEEPAPPPLEEDDGLTEEQRWEGLVADLEDALPKDRGAIHGRVTDPATGEPMVGVTIVGVRVAGDGTPIAAISDEHGYYKLEEMVPGRYLMTFYYLEVTLERDGIEVWPRAATPVFQQVPESAPVPSIDEEVAFSGVTTIETVYLIDGEPIE